MSNVARLHLEETASASTYLGPAEVSRAIGREVEVVLPKGGVERARLAIAYAYEPVPGDEVLVIGGPSGHYVIGVLHGQGKTTLHFPADAEVRAGGTLKITAERGVSIESPELSLSAKKLRAVAAEVVHTFTSLRQRVAELLSVQAGQSHTVVEGTSHTQSKSATILTQEKISINGKEVHLG